MSFLFSVAFLVIAVIAANVLKPFLPRIPEALVLIAIGAVFSLLPVFQDFSLDPEIFMFLIITPLMFEEGQALSFAKVKKNFSSIFQLSVTLAVIIVIFVALITDKIQSAWPLALAAALAAIVVPTDAVAVKSMTTGLKMPKGLNQSLELESLFNDATGIVLLDLSLAVFTQGSFSLTNGVFYFFLVAGGGLVIGTILAYLLVVLRTYLAFHVNSPQATTIPLNIMTPFIVYLAAEHFHLSGILAVVAAGIVSNWESARLQLFSTESQVVTNNIWETVNTLLNGIVFVILGLSFPTIFELTGEFGWGKTAGLILLAFTIYAVMFVSRFLWVSLQQNKKTEPFFGKAKSNDRREQARLFGFAGVHGAVTLSLALSLPKTVHGAPLPFRDEIIVVACLVIIISLLVATLALPLLLPKENQDYTTEELNAVRNQMIDAAILKSEDKIDNVDVRLALQQTLQSQKTTTGSHRRQFAPDYLALVADMADELNGFIEGPATERYHDETLTLYAKIVQRGFVKPAANRHPLLSFTRQLRHIMHETTFHVKTRTFTRRQRENFRKRYLAAHPDQQARFAQYKNQRQELLALNEEALAFADEALAKKLAAITAAEKPTAGIDQVRRLMNRFFKMVRHDYSKKEVQVPAALFIQAFGDEYRFVSQQLVQNKISPALADQLYNEINLAQTLQLMEAPSD
ncbi:sodium:proton antiporter [Leuconostocaceae bacterium ESL0958]|nr:sodium:proton antiporter [Leuconostocaceae bacterium ESL0958]